MPRYVIERDMQPSREELEEIGRRSVRVADEMQGLVWIRSYISQSDGKIYCEYEAPNPDALIEHARRVGIPADRVVEVALEVSPDMFR